MKKLIAKVKAKLSPSDKPAWIKVAEAEIGVKERVGSADNPRILEYHSKTSLKSTDDEVPWCSAFVNWVMAKCGLERSSSAAARSWLGYGEALPGFKRYAIVILKRGGSAWQGHVAFAMRDDGDTILCLGGNQSDEVRYSNYRKKDVIAYRWPRRPK